MNLGSSHLVPNLTVGKHTRVGLYMPINTNIICTVYGMENYGTRKVTKSFLNIVKDSTGCRITTSFGKRFQHMMYA